MQADHRRAYLYEQRNPRGAYGRWNFINHSPANSKRNLSFKDTLLRTPAKPSWEKTTEVEDFEDDMSDEEDATTR